MTTFAQRNFDAHRMSYSASPTEAARPTWGPVVNPPGDTGGPTESAASGWMTLAALAAVGGMFWWVTSGPKMARANPEEPWQFKWLRRDARYVIEKYEANGSMTEWKTGKSGNSVVISGVSIAHNPKIIRELESIAAEHGMVLDKVPTHKDMEFGLTTLVFTTKSTYRFNPSDPRDDGT